MAVRIVSATVHPVVPVAVNVTRPLPDIPALDNVIGLPTTADVGTPDAINDGPKVNVLAALVCVP